MSKLGSKELFLILVIINVVLYYFTYMIAVGPLKNQISTAKEQKVTLTQQRDERQEQIDQKPQIKDNIKNLKDEKAELFKSGFPSTDAEYIHAFLVDETKAANMKMNSISIAQAPRMSTNAAGQEVETGIMDNTITIMANSTYSNIATLLKEVEGLDKTSILTRLNLSGTAAEMVATMDYNFLSADKGEDRSDTTFDHEFAKGVGDANKLFK